MIHSVTVVNHIGDSLEMILKEPQKSGLHLYDIGGVGPGDAEINITEYATTDGGSFASSRLTAREVTMMIRFVASPTIEDARHRMYRYFPIKKQIKLIFHTDNRISYLNGYVKTSNPVIFNKETYAQLVISCPDPYYYSEDTGEIIFSGIEPSFEFEFSNESLTTPLLEMSEMKHTTQQRITYRGEADVGVMIYILMLGYVKNITIWDIITREHMVINTDRVADIAGSPLRMGDQIVINTVQGQKSIFLLRDGEFINILNSLDKDVDWLTLTQGNNEFAFGADEGEDNLEFRVEYNTIYEGL